MAAHTISEQVKAWRTTPRPGAPKGLTLEQAALLIGVAIATLFQWEAGTSLPSPMAVPGLALAMGVDAAALAGLVARERVVRLVGGGRKVVVGRRSHGVGSRRQPNRAGAA